MTMINKTILFNIIIDDMNLAKKKNLSSKELHMLYKRLKVGLEDVDDLTPENEQLLIKYYNMKRKKSASGT